MTIHQQIYSTLELSSEEAFAIIGGSDPNSITARREKMQLFLSEHEWSEEGYKEWLRSSLPTPTQMAGNILSAAKNWAQQGFQFTSEEEQQQRLGFCRGCEYFIDNSRCTQCGCFMEFKAKLVGMQCPIGKW